MAACMALVALSIPAAPVYAANPADAKLSNVGGTIYVRSEPQGYVGIYRGRHASGVELTALASASASDDYRINSWKTALVLQRYGFSYQPDIEGHVDTEGGVYGESYVSKPKRKRPRSVWKDVTLRYSASELDSFAAQVCNAHAETLRQQNVPDGDILKEDRIVDIYSLPQGKSVVVRSHEGFFHDFVGADPISPRELKMVCMGLPKPSVATAGDLKGSTAVTNAHLTILKQSTLGGSCKVNLSTVVTTDTANTEVRFRFEHTNGKLSDIKSVITSHTKKAMDAYWYDVPFDPAGDEMGSIRMVGVSHEFTSDWEAYHMTCNAASPGDVATTAPPAPPKRTSVKPSVELLLEPTAKVMHRGLLCPTKVKVTAKIHSKMAFTGTGLVHMKQGGHSFAKHDVQLSPFIVWQHLDEFDLKPWGAVNAPTGMAGGSHTLQGLPGSANSQSTQRFELRYVLTNNQAPVVTTPFEIIAVSCVDPKVNGGIQPAMDLGLNKPEPPQQAVPRPLAAERQDLRRPEEEKPTPARVAPATLQLKPPASPDEPREPRSKAPKPQMRSSAQPDQAAAQDCKYDPNSARLPCWPEKRKPMKLINPFE
ncbi:hypothetical protein NBRC116584_28600 [Hydrogenophaga sp. 5NK40-0174]